MGFGEKLGIDNTYWLLDCSTQARAMETHEGGKTIHLVITNIFFFVDKNDNFFFNTYTPFPLWNKYDLVAFVSWTQEMTKGGSHCVTQIRVSRRTNWNSTLCLHRYIMPRNFVLILDIDLSDLQTGNSSREIKTDQLIGTKQIAVTIMLQEKSTSKNL